MTRKRRLYIVGGVVGTLLLAPMLAWWWFFHTAAGVEFLLARLDRVKGMKLVATEVTGSLAGPLSIKRFELDSKYVRIEVDNIELDLLPVALLSGTVRASSVRASQAIVTVKAVNEPPSTKPLRFLPNFLRISIGTAHFDRARVTLANGSVIDAAPVAVGDGFGMSATRMNIDGAALKSERFDAAGQFTLLAQRPIGLEADVHGMLRLPRGPAWQATVQVSGTSQALNLKVNTQAPAPVRFDGALKYEQHWTLTGTVASDAFSLQPWLDQPPLEPEQFALDVEIANGRIAATGDVLVPQIDAAPLKTDVAFRYADNALQFERANLRLANSDSEVRAAGRIDFGGETPRIDARAQWSNLRWPLRGGEFASPRGSGAVVGAKTFAIAADADLLLIKQTPAHVAIKAKVDKQAIDIERYTVGALKGEMRGAARLSLNKLRDWRIDVTATRIDPQWFSAALPGVIDLRAQAQGQGLDKNALFDAKIERLHGTVRNARIDAHGGVGRTRDGWSARALNATWGANHVELDGKVGRVNNLKWRIEAKELHRLFSDVRGELYSRGSARDTGGGADARHLQGDIRAKDLQVGVWRVGELTGDIDLDPTGKTNSQLDIVARDLSIGPLLLDTAHLVGGGTDTLHTLQFNATMPAEAYEQVPLLELHAQGAFADGAWRGMLAPLKFSDHYGRTPKLDLAAAPVLISAQRLNVNQWCVVWSDRKLCADAAWSKDGPWRVAFASDELELNLFDPILGDKTQLTGRWQIDGQFSSAPKPDTAWVGDAHLRVLDSAVLYEAVENAQEAVQVGTGQLDMTATAQQLTAALHLTSPGTTSINARMQVERSATQSIVTQPLSAELQARTSDANVLPLFFVDLDAAAGTLDTQLRLAGTLSDPLLDGRVSLRDGALDLYRINLALRALSADVDIVANRLQFKGDGRLGEGTLDVAGNMEWRSGKPAGALRLRGDNLLVSDLPEYRIVASPDIRFAVDGARIDVRGDVTIPSARLQPADLRGAVQRSPDARLVGIEPTSESSQFRVDSNINVRLGDDVNVNAFGLQAQLGGAVEVIAHPGEQARGRGEVFVRKGNYRAYGQDINIERGRLLFEASPLDNPGLDILATRLIEDQTVGVNVRGTLRAPRMSFYADPSLPQMQIVAYLLTGKPVEDMRTQDATAVGSATDSLAMQGGGLLASQIGSRIGIEHVSFESKGVDDTSVVLGKFLSPRLFVSYGISLTESINTLKARYTISNRWLLKAEAGQDQSADLEFRIER